MSRAVRRETAADAPSSVSSPLRRTWDDIYEVFGNGDEYDWALEGEDEMFGAAGDGEAPKISDVRCSLPPSPARTLSMEPSG